MIFANRFARFRWSLAATAAMIAAPALVPAGVRYQAPTGGWRHTYDGTFAPGVVDPGFVGGVGPAGYGDASDQNALDGTWLHTQSDKWDGSGPGDPLSDPTVPSNPLGSVSGRQGVAPGGAAALVENGVDYLRVQDAGNPEVHGWVQGNVDDPGGPDEPINTNRRVYFGHNMQQDGALVGDDELVIDNGITLSFRARIPVAGPLDDIYSTDDDNEDSLPDVRPWFDGAPNGRGFRMLNGRGLINVVQNDPVFQNEDTLVGFGLVTSTDVGDYCGGGGSGSLCGGTGSGGLVMNNLNGNTPTSSIDSESGGELNIVELADDQLNEWNEFWITMEGNGPVIGNTTVSVYVNGETTPQVFEVTLASRGNGVYSDEQDPFLEFGFSRNGFFGSLDLDFLSYQLGVIEPVGTPALPGDYNDDGRVDAADYTVFRDNLSRQISLPGENPAATTPGLVDDEDRVFWASRYGSGSGPVGVPEPTGMLTVAALLATFGVSRSRR